MRFRYQYKRLDCTLCADMKKGVCPHMLCPHIMDNLSDLIQDPAFVTAVSTADRQPTPHQPTNLHLQKAGFTLNLREQPKAPAPDGHGTKSALPIG